MHAHIETARALALYLSEQGDAFYQDLDELFQAAIQVHALRDHGIDASQIRVSIWQRNPSELSYGDRQTERGVVSCLIIEKTAMGPDGTLGLRPCAHVQVPEIESETAHFDTEEFVADVLLRYSKDGSDFQKALLNQAAAASAWLHSQALSADTAPVLLSRQPPRI